MNINVKIISFFTKRRILESLSSLILLHLFALVDLLDSVDGIILFRLVNEMHKTDESILVCSYKMCKILLTNYIW